MSYIKYIDPFHGNSEIDLPNPQGIAANWFLPKALSGNTHPGACIPFGMVSASAYSGAYVTGYGVNSVNCFGAIPKLFDKYYASGFTHFHPSGTGNLKCYGNYIRVIPVIEFLERIDNLWELQEETACPGYYSTVLKSIDVHAES